MVSLFGSFEEAYANLKKKKKINKNENYENLLFK